jgi:hypothetical protein
MTDLSLIIDELHGARAEAQARLQDATDLDVADDWDFVYRSLSAAIVKANEALNVWKLYS